MALDTSFWHLSRDYVYLPQQFQSNGWVIGLLSGTIAAASAVVGPRPPPSAKQVGVAFATGCVVLLAATLAGGLLGGVTGKLHRAAASEQLLAPIARVYTCEGLWRGAVAGAAAGTVVVCLLYRRFRRPA